MGAQWKHAGKQEKSGQKGAVIHKLLKEVMVAAKLGGPTVDANPRLRAAVDAARKQSVPKDNIERAIKKGSGQLDEQVNYETVVFEGYAPHQVPIIVDCLTENKNRTSSEVRLLFKAGQLGTPGSVAWQFDRVGLVEAHTPNKAEDIESVAIEAGAQNVEPMAEGGDVPASAMGARFICEISDLDSVNKFLQSKGWTVIQCEPGYFPKNTVNLSPEQMKDVYSFLQDLDDNEDVHRIYAAVK